MLTSSELIEFEDEVARRYANAEIRGPIHLSDGNEEQLIEIFKQVNPEDWVFSAWRCHYHALLHGVPRDKVMDQIIAGRSMNLSFPDHRFFASAIVGGCLPIAVGVAEAIKRKNEQRHVWCFVGDMTASIGMFADCQTYASDLPITFVIEDNGVSVKSPTEKCWKGWETSTPIHYTYQSKYPHSGLDKLVQF